MNRLVTLFLLSIIATSMLRAQCVSGDCENGKGAFILSDGSKYIGQFKNGEISGEGNCYYEDGSIYQGEWLKGYPHGKGIKILPSGTKEEGIWRKGYLIKEEEINVVDLVKKGRDENQTGCIQGNCQNGNGMYIYASGAVYIGEFRNGEIQGVGVCYYSDGSKYQGEWVNRFPEGRGTKIFPDGTRRTGLWKKGQPVDELGNVILESLIASKQSQTDETEIQSGCISGNCENGKGVFAYPDGGKYDGEFVNGKPEGYGTFFYFDGKKHVGNFSEGFANGNGTLYKTDGTAQSGYWKNGEFLGSAAATAPAQTGCIKGDCRNGTGTYVFKDGAKYTGTFVNGYPQGKGIAEYPNGERYEGEMAEGSFNGYGTLSLPDGNKVAGFWRQGTYLGSKNPYILKEEHTSIEPAPPFDPGASVKIWALVIGVAAYNHMPVLRYTDDDAYRIYAFLKSPEGGALPDEQLRILVDEEATLDNIKTSMEELFGKSGPNDMVLLYFSGHGLKGSFLPIDFDGFYNKLSHEEISAILKRSPAKYKLCIADACHSGSLLAMRSTAAQSIITSYYETLAQTKAGTALIMSSKSEETSLESSGLRQGVFTHFLIRGLKGEADSNADRIVSVEELYKFVYDNVRSYTGNQQSPVLMGDYDKKMPVGMKR